MRNSNQDSNKTPVVAWALYSWADSAFALCVLAAFFPVLLKNYYTTGNSTVALGFANGISGISAAILCPIVASIIARNDLRQKSLTLFSILGAATTVLLYFVQAGQYMPALFLFAVANIFYRLSIMSHDSLLPAVADFKNRHRVSAIGFGAGYLGCTIVFIVSILTISHSGQIKHSLLIAGIWWIIFAIPLYTAKVGGRPRLTAINNWSPADLKQTIAFAWNNPQIRIFLIAYWFYIDGVHSFVMMATDYGLSLGFSQKTLMYSLLIVQLTAFPFAIISGLSAAKFGAKRILLISVFVYTTVTICAAWLMSEEWHFLLFAFLTGLVQGGIQSVSRSYFSLIIPKDKSTELFGLFNTVGRFAVAAGPILIALTVIFAQNLGFSETIPQRIGISSLILPFALGFILLAKQPMKPIS